MGEREAFVVPLDRYLSADEAAHLDPWELVARGQGILVSWQPQGSSRGTAFGTALAGSSALSKQLTSVLSSASTATAVQSTQGLFRIELPTGSTLQQLVPAVGGGFRGLVRATDSSAIAGHVRLIPATGAAVAGGAALGPVLAVMALTVGAEMLARHQLQRKLNDIQAGVNQLLLDVDQRREAQLKSVERALELASAALLDRVTIPDAIGLGPARDNLRVLLHQGLDWLETWERGVEGLKTGSTGVDYRHVRKVLGVKESDTLAFARRVSLLYRALALDARAEVLTASEAALTNPDQSLTNLQRRLSGSLTSSAEHQDRLRNVLWRLAEEPLGMSLPTMPNTGKKVAALDRMLRQLAAAASKDPAALPMLSPVGRQVLDVVRQDDGSVEPHAPETRAS